MSDSNLDYKFFTTTRSAWAAMYQAMEQASTSIYWEVYIFIDDEAGAPFVELLANKARSGVDVKIVVDAFGSFGFSKASIEHLESSGVQFKWDNRLVPQWNIREWWRRLSLRNHRKVLIIDGTAAFVGGVNVSSEAAEWEDVQLAVRSPRLVKHLERAFAKDYMRAGGLQADVKELIKRPRNPWVSLKEQLSFIAHSPPRLGAPSFLRGLYFRSLAAAKQSFTLLTPYYVPDRLFLRLVRRAVRRGVAVDILVPTKTDMNMFDWVHEHFYERTVEAGARLFLLPRMNHGKAWIQDTTAALVGSGNLTPRSFFSNKESAVYFRLPHMIGELASILDTWKREAFVIERSIIRKTSWPRSVRRLLGRYVKYFF